MANILLTEKCVRSCPYCFAKQHMDNAFPDDILTWDNLIYIADFLQASGVNTMSLLGGEPFLHPEITEFILYLHSRNFHVSVFTSGIFVDNDKYELFKKKIKSIPNIRLSFICNVNDPKKTSKLELKKVCQFLYDFSYMITLSFNIYRTDFDLSFLFNYIISYGLNRNIRFGVAHPTPGQKNYYIPPEKFYLMKDQFLSFTPYFEKYNIVPGLDCGFPMCIFSDEELGKLYKLSEGKLKFECGPAIDIGMDMMVWGCFPLSEYYKKSLYEFESINNVIDFYRNKMEIIRKEAGGIYTQCDTCHHRKTGLCSGGCIAHIMNNIMLEEPCRQTIKND